MQSPGSGAGKIPAGTGPHARGRMGDTHGGTGFVHVLAAGPAGPVHINAQIPFINVNIDFILNLRIDKDGSKRGLSLTPGVNGEILTRRWTPDSAFMNP